jgi:hypothetical protein
VPKRITIRLSPEVLQWARRKIVDEKTSFSKLIGELLQREISNGYWSAYEQWKSLPDDLGGSIDASRRFTRNEAHERP